MSKLSDRVEAAAGADREMDELVDLLTNFPANGKPQGDMKQVAVAYGLIAPVTQNKNCPACGTTRPDYTYFKITPAGKLLLRARGL